MIMRRIGLVLVTVLAQIASALPALAEDKSCNDEYFRDRYGDSFFRPEVMAIGDSLYHGVRSLQITQWYVDNSVPALIAQALGLMLPGYEKQPSDTKSRRERKFATPLLPPKMKSNGPNIHEMSIDLSIVPGYLVEHSRVGFGQMIDWIYARRKADNQKNVGALYSDNLAIGSLAIEHLFFLTPRQLDKEVAIIGKKIKNPKGSSNDKNNSFEDRDVGNAFFYLNAKLVMDPTSDPCLQDSTILDIVELRQPKRLLVSLGSNNGIWEVAFNARDIDQQSSYSKEEDEYDPYLVLCLYHDFSKKIPEKLPRKIPVKDKRGGISIKRNVEECFAPMAERLIQRLSKSKVEYIYFNDMAFPRLIANLMPARSKPPSEYAGGCVAYDRYYTVFAGTSDRSIDGKKLCDAERVATKASQGLQTLMEKMNKEYGARHGNRWTPISVNSVLKKFDVKHRMLKSLESPFHIELKNGGFRAYGNNAVSFDLRNLRSGYDCNIDGATMKCYHIGLDLNPKLRNKWKDDPAVSRATGLFSLDNMHPSSLGYLALSRELCDKIVSNELFGVAGGLMPQCAKVLSDNMTSWIAEIERHDSSFFPSESHFQFLRALGNAMGGEALYDDVRRLFSR